MIDTKNMNRIIGDYFEINSDIVAKEFNSKLPKFISKRIAKKQRLKLLDSLTKFRESNYIMNWINIVELFTYIYNNFDVDHKYKGVTKVEMYNNTLEALVEFDGYYALIFFDHLPEGNNNEEIKFNLRMRYISTDSNDTRNGIDIYLSSLKATSRNAQKYVDELNYVLRNYICDYIEETLNKYLEDNS